jgi:hypothetical protein
VDADESIRAERGPHIWLKLAEEYWVEVPREDAMKMREAEFVSIYRRHVAHSSRPAAVQWARAQMAARAAAA